MHGVDRRVCAVDTDIDTDSRQRSSDPDPNCQKMGESKRRVEEGGFEGGEQLIRSIVKIWLGNISPWDIETPQ